MPVCDVAGPSVSVTSPERKRVRLSEEDEEEKEKKPEEQKTFGFEHLEHPADIQLHAWGPTMETAMEQLVISMYAYLIDDMELSLVDETYEYYFTASGTDAESLVFQLLDEALVAFQSEPFFIGRRVVVDSLDMEKFEVSFHGIGESYDIVKHKQGADVKAITYSNMQIIQKKDRCDLYVIVDI